MELKGSAKYLCNIYCQTCDAFVETKELCQEHFQLNSLVPCSFFSVTTRLGMNQAHRVRHRRILYNCPWSSCDLGTPIVINQFPDLLHKSPVPFPGTSTFEKKFDILGVQFLQCQMEREGRGVSEKEVSPCKH